MKHTTLRRSQRLKGASERAKNTSRATPNGLVPFLERVICDPFSVDTHRPESPKMRLNGHPVGRNRLWRCVWAILRGWEPPQVGVGTWEKGPRIRHSVRLPRDTAIVRSQPARHIRGPNEPVLGPTDTVRGHIGPNTVKKATQTVPKLILSINLDNGTF